VVKFDTVAPKEAMMACKMPKKEGKKPTPKKKKK